MLQLFREFFWMVFPILGMGLGAFAIWNEFSRQRKALDVLKIYADKGVEPPASVLEVLSRASTSRPVRSEGPVQAAMPRAAFFFVLATGLAVMAVWSLFSSTGWSFTMGLGLGAFALAAVGAGAYVAGKSPRPSDEP